MKISVQGFNNISVTKISSDDSLAPRTSLHHYFMMIILGLIEPLFKSLGFNRVATIFEVNKSRTEKKKLCFSKIKSEVQVSL